MFDDKFIDALARALVPAVAARMQEHLGNGTNGTITPRLFTVAEAAKYLGRSKVYVQHLVAQRRLPVVREGGRVFLDVRELNRWIDANTEPAGESAMPAPPAVPLPRRRSASRIA